MARYGNIFAGAVENTMPQSNEAAMNAATPPGTLVILNGSGEYIAHNAQGVRGSFFVLSEGTITQSGTDTDIPADGTGIGFYPLDGCFFHALVEDAVACVKEVTLLTSNGTGQLEIAASGDEVLFVAAETYTTSGGAELVTVRPYSGSVA